MLDIQNLVRVHSIGNDLHDVKVEFNRDLTGELIGVLKGNLICVKYVPPPPLPF